MGRGVIRPVSMAVQVWVVGLMEAGVAVTSAVTPASTAWARMLAPSAGHPVAAKDHRQDRTSSLRCGRSILTVISPGKIGAYREDGEEPGPDFDA